MLHIYIYDISTLRVNGLTFILLTWRKWLAPNNASREQMGFNSGFKGLKIEQFVNYLHGVVYHFWCVRPAIVPIIHGYFYCCLNAIISSMLPEWKHGHVQINCLSGLFISAAVLILVLAR